MPTPVPVHRQATRRLALQFDEHGNPMFASVCSPQSFQARGLAVVPRRHVIPVIFVPGIMGTNLRTKKEFNKDQPSAWYPPNGTIEGLGEWNTRRKQKNAQRQLQLTPNHCEVDPGGKVSLSGEAYTLTDAEAKRRGWGEVHWESYGMVLTELERVLNDQYENCGQHTAYAMQAWQIAQTLKQHGQDVMPKWNPVKGSCSPLSEAEFTRLDDYYYPVWACGYNWLESSEQSAQRLVTRIEEALAWYARPECHFIPEGKVLIVTHSMGGLVTRRAAQQAEGKIIGVVHGVQPVGGAPVVYRRFRAGTEYGGWWDIAGKMAATVLGGDAGAVTCVMANAPGPMELLPTKHYPPGWLRFEREVDDTTQTLMPALPQADPYEEIYAKRVQDVWWGMVDETLIDPAEMAKQSNMTPLEAYHNSLSQAHDFHESLQLYFHPQTYGHYGSDKKQESFGAVRWEARDPVPDSIKASLPSTQATSWTEEGAVVLGEGKQRVRWRLANKADPQNNDDENAGDGTVPRPSGKLIEVGAGVQLVCRMKGFDHQHSYGDEAVLQNVAYSLGKLIQLATPIDQLPQSKGSSWTDTSTDLQTDIGEPASSDASPPSSSSSSESQP